VIFQQNQLAIIRIMICLGRQLKTEQIIDYELAFYRETPFSARVYENNGPEE